MVGGDYEVSFYGLGAVTRMGSSRRIIRYAHPGPSNVSNFGFFYAKSRNYLEDDCFINFDS